MKAFFTGLFTWIVTIFFGMILLDVVYANLVPKSAVAISEVTDLLLLIGALTILAAIGAIAFSWNASLARNFFIASLILLLLEFLAPTLPSPLIGDTQGSTLSTAIRLVISGSASLLALFGLHNLYRAVDA